MTKKKAKTDKFLTYICPICAWKTIGNWPDMQDREYFNHYHKEHYPKPIIIKHK